LEAREAPESLPAGSKKRSFKAGADRVDITSGGSLLAGKWIGPTIEEGL
jgi:hypothetical protein